MNRRHDDPPPLPEKNEIIPTRRLILLCRLYGREDLALRIGVSPPPSLFSSDGCSAWPDEWDKVSIYPACFWHDVEYWLGGSDKQRLAADLRLAQRVLELTNDCQLSVELSVAMFYGVRGMGNTPLKFPFTWGFGWPGVPELPLEDEG